MNRKTLIEIKFWV